MVSNHNRDAPLISIVTPVYNGERFLTAAHACLEAQRFVDFEWILVDDGSRDGSVAAARALVAASPLNVRLEVLEANRGAAGARNAGLAVAGGQYVKFFDVDDFLEANHLEVLSDLAREKGADVMVSPTVYRMEVGQREISYVDRNYAEMLALGNTLARFVVKPGFHHCGCLYRRTLVSEIGGFDESLATDEDGWFCVQLFLHGATFAYTDDTHFTYNVWYTGPGDNLSANTTSAHVASRIKVCQRLGRIAERSDDPELRRALAARMGAVALETGHVDYASAKRLMQQALSLSRDFRVSAYPAMLRWTARLGFRTGLQIFQAFKQLRKWKIELGARFRQNHTPPASSTPSLASEQTIS